MEIADILIVDGDPQVSKLICRTLENSCYKIVSVQNGEEALKLVSEIQFKVVISDVKMSKMDGFELLDRVHELNPDITRIIVSGHSDVELILKLVNEKGIDKYLIKPWENADLILAISKCIELYDLRREVNKLQAKLNSRKSTCPHPDWWELINLCPLRPRIYNQYFCGQPRHEHDHQLYRRPCFCGPDGLRHPEA